MEVVVVAILQKLVVLVVLVEVEQVQIHPHVLEEQETHLAQHLVKVVMEEMVEQEVVLIQLLEEVEVLDKLVQIVL